MTQSGQLATAALAQRLSSAAIEPLPRALPKSPVLGWDSFLPRPGGRMPSVADLPFRSLTTSGRAALLAALRQLDLPAGSGVMVPTYHCPTMVAPILRDGLRPIYFPINDDGLPLLGAIEDADAAHTCVMFVAHYFGLPRDLEAVADWARRRGIVLVEDCAHSYFGMAGSRPVGHWGDFATASLSKFFPVPEGGMLASAVHSLRPLRLQPADLRTEIKGLVDVIELSARHRRLGGLRHVTAPLLWVKNRGEPALPLHAPDAPGPADAQAMMDECDMARAGQRAALTTRCLHATLPNNPIVERRRRNYRIWSNAMAAAPGARGLCPSLPDGAAPYVWPLWVDGPPDRVEAIYAQIRHLRLPVFRWDRLWPGTPLAGHDAGPRWSRHVLQLLCHQSLSDIDIQRVAAALCALLRRP